SPAPRVGSFRGFVRRYTSIGKKERLRSYPHWISLAAKRQEIEDTSPPWPASDTRSATISESRGRDRSSLPGWSVVASCSRAIWRSALPTRFQTTRAPPEPDPAVWEELVEAETREPPLPLARLK